jgi:hypothetical protein
MVRCRSSHSTAALNAGLARASKDHHGEFSDSNGGIGQSHTSWSLGVRSFVPDMTSFWFRPFRIPAGPKLHGWNR